MKAWQISAGDGTARKSHLAGKQRNNDTVQTVEQTFSTFSPFSLSRWAIVSRSFQDRPYIIWCC